MIEPETGRVKRLLELAKQEFGNISPAEEKLFRGIAKGQTVDYSTGSDVENDPSNALKWTADRVLTAVGIAWLCTDPQASALVTYRGISVKGARVDGPLDLQFAHMPFRFRFENCSFQNEVVLRSVGLQGLYLLNTHTKGINATGAKIENDVFFRNGFRAEGEVNLVGATIGGNVSCIGAQFINVGGVALNAHMLKVEGTFFLRDGFKAQGEVNLVGATIGKTVECDGGQMINPAANALNADRLKVEGGVFLRSGFKAEGEVRLLGARIGGDLDCEGGQMVNPNGKALNADGLKVEGSVFLRKRFNATGKVRFVNAIVGRYFVWREIPTNSDAILDLRSAKVGTLLDEKKSWPGRDKLLLHGFVYDEIGHDAPTDADSRIQWLHLQPAGQFLPQPYEQLASVLRKAGHDEDAREVLIEKNRDRAQRTKWYELVRWWYTLLDITVGYGYRPWRAFGWSLGIICLGWICFCAGYNADLMMRTKEGPSENFPEFSAALYSFETFVPLTKLQIAEYWLPNANLGTPVKIFGARTPKWASPTEGSLLRFYLWFHSTAGLVLTTLWVGGLTGLIKT
jgi:sRNA-binding regulator protein Hfq